jgi:anti-sigma B factor antagonist
MLGSWISSSANRRSGVMADEKPHVSVKNSGGVNIVEFADRKILEELSISEIGEELFRVVAGMDDVKMLLSFKNVEHLSSAALGMLITLNKHVAEKKGKLKLSDITPQIYEVFKITRLNKLFSVYGTAKEALADF